MGMRALSGIIKAFEGPRQGRVTIGFNPHRVISGDAPVLERRETGDTGDFSAPPVVSVALRQIWIVDAPFRDSAGFVIDDRVTATELVVSWDAQVEGLIDEISYLVIGTV